MVIDPTQLARSVAARSAIDYDKACGNCNYNLRGLTRAAVCPECGTPIDCGVTPGESASAAGKRSSRPSGPRTVMDFSWAELGRLGTAATMVSWGMLTVALAMGIQWLRWLFLAHGWEDRSGPVAAVLLGIAAVGSACAGMGTLRIVTQASAVGQTEHGHKPKATYAAFLKTLPLSLRLCSAGLVPALAVGFGVAAAGAMLDHNSPLAHSMTFVAVTLLVVGFVGLGLLSVIIHALSYIIGDDLALNRGMIGAAGVPLCGFVLALSPVWGPLGGFDGYIAPGTVLTFSVIVSIVPVMWLAGVLSFGQSCRWTQRNILIREEKDQRALDRAARETARMNQRMAQSES
ncbi:MAG: hypothetical protein ACT4PL_12830 [Phycisphaerales bacterium]